MRFLSPVCLAHYYSSPDPDSVNPQIESSTLDRIMPHPDYHPQNWICVLNPTEATLERVRTFLAEAYELARARSARRAKTD